MIGHCSCEGARRLVEIVTRLGRDVHRLFAVMFESVPQYCLCVKASTVEDACAAAQAI